MRPRITWFIVGAVLVVGLLAGIDALRSSDEPPPASPERDRAVATTTREAIETIQVDLTERNSSGQSGTATVERNDDGTLNVTIELSGGSGEPQPAYIQRGRCSARFTDFELQSPIDELRSLPDVVNGTSTSEYIDLPESTSGRANYVVAVHKSAAELETRVACGDITQAPTTILSTENFAPAEGVATYTLRGGSPRVRKYVAKAVAICVGANAGFQSAVDVAFEEAAVAASDWALANRRALSPPRADRVLVNQFLSSMERERDTLRQFDTQKRIRATHQKDALADRLSARWGLRPREVLRGCPVSLPA
jgi:hypothetical protein